MKEEVLLSHQHEGKTYTVHDVSIVFNNGKIVEGTVAYSVDGGDLRTSDLRFDAGERRAYFFDQKLGSIPGFVDEVAGELREAAAYQRDLNREMN